MSKKIVISIMFAMFLLGLGGTATVPVSNAKEITEIGIAAGRPGDAWNVLSHALAGFINERSEWLRAAPAGWDRSADRNRPPRSAADSADQGRD